MKIEIEKLSTNPANAMRRAGYTFQRQEGEEMSFVRPFSQSGYPRFHVYVKVVGAGLAISFHYDAKKETYGEGTRHHGEYEEGGILKEEVERLKKALA
ncbi:MAG: hypothetical protein WCV59_01395 [Parcubacteria group bacterium]|jgi:hypothetical protein